MDPNLRDHDGFTARSITPPRGATMPRSCTSTARARMWASNQPPGPDIPPTWRTAPSSARSPIRRRWRCWRSSARRTNHQCRSCGGTPLMGIGAAPMRGMVADTVRTIARACGHAAAGVGWSPDCCWRHWRAPAPRPRDTEWNRYTLEGLDGVYVRAETNQACEGAGVSATSRYARRPRPRWHGNRGAPADRAGDARKSSGLPELRVAYECGGGVAGVVGYSVSAASACRPPR